MTIAQQLIDLGVAKTAIKAAIELKGVTVGGVPFLNYADKIGSIANGSTSWVRPADWVDLPTVLATDDKLVGLYMVTKDSCFCAFVAEGAYTVDWGDGTSNNYAAREKAGHQYTYGAVGLGAATSKGWQQAIIVITPQAGQRLTSLNLNAKHAFQTGANTPNSGFVIISKMPIRPRLKRI